MEKNAYFIKLEKKFLELGIKKGSTVIVCSDILKLLILFKKKKMSFNLDDFINSLIKTIGKSGTLIFYSFNWNFFEGKVFDYNKSKSFSGSLSNAALKRKDFKRSKSPVYSLLVYGKHQKKICKMEHYDCFSLKSPFGYLIKRNAKCLFFDLDYKNAAFPFFHVAEQHVKVYYRFFKIFSGKVINGKKIKQKRLKMFVRKKNYKITTIYSKSTDKYLKGAKALIKDKFFNIDISLLDIKKLYQITVKQLRIEDSLFLRRKSDN